MIDTRLVVETVQKSRGNKLNEIAVALVVFAKQNEMVGTLRVRSAVFVIVGRHIHFTPNDRLHAVGGGFVIKIRCREKVSVIGDRNSRHPPPCRFGRKFPNFASAVQQGIIGMEMQMYEIRRCHVVLF